MIEPITKQPWCWRTFGKVLMLVTLTGGSKVVLCGKKQTPLLIRDEQSGLLRPIVEDDDAARLIASAPQLRILLQEMVDNYRPFTLKPVGAPGSQARAEQDSQIAAHTKARALLERLREVEP